MKIEVEPLSPVEKKVIVELDSERVTKELDRAYTNLGRKVKLRGFRVGKVPRNVLERHFREEVESEVVKVLLSAGFGDAMREQDLAAVAPPQFDLEGREFKKTEPFRFTARVEVMPKLEPKGYRGLEVTRRQAEVTDDMIATELAQIQQRMSRLVPVEGRFEAQEGDYAIVEQEGTIGTEPIEVDKTEGMTVQVVQGDLAEGNMPQLLGRKIGEVVELEHAFPSDHRAEHLRGKVARLRVTMKTLKTRETPSLDELVKDIGLEGVDTLDQLRARIREGLEKFETRRSESELKQALVSAALAKNDFEVPPALVERTIDAMIDAMTPNAGGRLPDQGAELRSSRLRAELREAALLQVKRGLLLDAIAGAEKIDVSEEEVQAEIAKTAAQLHMPLAKLQREMHGDEARLSLRKRMREEKALAFLIGEAKLQ
ncbi:MAG TPA: trigger factor [Anaeromyxobacteraceae bacterium]|nr:trigger factor [Anaeromyxobacteraceae bacterium]